MPREMKDSGFSWIGEVPNSWKVVPVKVAFSEIRTKNSDGAITNALKFKFGEIVPKSNFDSETDDYVADTILNYTVVEPKTIMINGLNLNYDFKTLRTGLVKEKSIITSAYLALKPDENIIWAEYATYLFKGYETKMAFHNMGSGIRLTLGFKEFKNQPLLLPALPEQKAIAAFLDTKCSEIDSVIERTKATIEEYKKLKQSIITEAVTKGIRGDRPMKDSGIEWIGDIPARWDIKVAFQLFSQVKNKNEGLVEQNLLSLSYGKIKRKSIDAVGGLLPENFDGYNIIEKDDIVLRLTDLQNDHTSLRVGLSNERGIVTSAYVTLRNQSDNTPLYLYYYLHSFDLCKGFYGMGAGVRQGLNWEGLKLLKIALPPIDEQKEITDFLEKKCAEIDALVTKKEQIVVELEAYKKSLIYEVVTGKREV